jgi:hypothetical protein
MQRRCLTTMAVMGLLAVFCFRAAAQESRGSIVGSVMDGQSAAIANARVSILNVETGVATPTKTNGSGSFEADFLIPGAYALTAEAAGFKKLVRTGLVLEISGRIQVDLRMEIGAVSESVTVSSASPILETTNGSTGRVIEQKELAELPVGQLDPMNMQILSPDIMFEGLSTSSSVTANGGNSEYRTMGAIGYNEYTFDGVPLTAITGQPGFTPGSDMVDEMKLQTSNFDAQTGFTAGVTVSLTSKGGTNEYHGSLSDQMYQTRWNATPYFTRLAWLNGIKNGTVTPNTPEQASGRQNTFGVTLGGPVRIPKLYNGKNKFFFYFVYNGYRQNTLGTTANGNGLNYSVPETPWWTGDFSALQKVNPTLYTIYDPSTGALSNGQVTRTPFSGNIVPQSRITDPLVPYYKKIYPTPNNVPGIVTAEGFNDYFATDQPSVQVWNSYMNRYDYNINANHRIFVKWYMNRLDADSADWTYQSAPGLLSSAAVRAGTGGDASYVWVISRSTVFTLGAAITRYHTGSDNTMQKAIEPSQVGLPAYMDAASGNLHVLPSILFTTQQSVNLPYPTVPTNTTDTLNADFVTVIKRHSVKYGWDERRYHYATPPTGYTSGAFTFNNAYDKQAANTTTAGTWGLEFASFLMGTPSTITYTKPDAPYWSSPARGLYFQDDWRVNSKLTVNLGLRYEYQGGITERYNQGISGNFVFNQQLPYSSAVQTAYSANPIPEVPTSQFQVEGGIQYLGQPNSTFTNGVNDFMPRAGAAWQIRSDTVLRLGYGWFDDILNPLGLVPSNQFGFSQATSTVPTTDNGLTFCCGGVSSIMSNPFPNGFIQPYKNSLGTAALSGQSFTYWPRDYHPARQQRWRAGLQHQFGRDMVAEFGYEGSYARIPNVIGTYSPTQPVDYVPQQYYCGGAVRNTTCDTNLTQLVANPFYIGNLQSLQQSNPALYNYLATQSTFSSATISKARLLEAFPQYTGLSGVRPGNSFAQAQGKNIYRNLTFQFQKRFSYDFSSSVGYTHSSGAIQDYYLNPFDSGPSWEANLLAPPNHFVWSTVWELPVGAGKKWLTHGLAGKMLGGWQLGWIYMYQTGLWQDPYNSSAVRFWGNDFFYGNLNDLGQLMNHSAARAQNTLEWFSPSVAYTGSGPIPAGFQGFDGRAASQPGTYQIRTVPRTLTALPIDGVRNWDLRVQKVFTVRERIRVQAMVQGLNLTNHTQFNGPDITPTDSAFGFVNTQRNVPRFIELSLRIQF